MDEFLVLDNLGAGASAVTFKARVLPPDLVKHFGVSEVAIKVPQKQTDRTLLRTELLRLGFLHEILNSHTHPGKENIVRFLGMGNYRNGQVTEIVGVFELLPGNLRHLLGNGVRQTPLETRLALTISEGILQGLCLLHQIGILHRDIKPENILMDGEVPKLIDFGLSRLLTADQIAYSIMGTPEYASPELNQGQGAGLSADIWAVGVTMYEMFVGRRPFGSREDLEFQESIKQGRFEPLHAVRPDLSRPLSELISRAISPDPKSRPSAEQMLHAIQRIAMDPEDRCQAEINRIRTVMQTSLGSLNTLENQARDLTNRFPMDPRAYLMLAEFLNMCHRPDEALIALMRGLNKEPDNSSLLFAIATDAWARGRYAEALEYLKKSEDACLEAAHRAAAAALRIACNAALAARA